MNEIDVKGPRDISQAFVMADSIIKKNYLAELSKFELVHGKFLTETPAQLKDSLNCSVRFFDVTQIVLNKNENMRDKLVTVFNAVGNTGASLLFHISGDKNSVSIRIGIKNSDKNTQNTMLAQNVLENSLLANFPGTKMSRMSADELKDKILNGFSSSQTVATVTDIAGLRSEEESDEKQFMQGIEKLIDAMQGKIYTLFLIADPVSLSDLNENRFALESIYSQLVPFSCSQYSVGESESSSVNESVSIGATDSISKSIAHSVSHTAGKTFSTTVGTSHTETNGISRTVTDGVSHTTTNGTSTGTTFSTFGAKSFGGHAGIGGFGFNSSSSAGTSFGTSFSRSHSVANGITHSNSEGVQHSVSNTSSNSSSRGINESDTTGTITTEGSSRSSSRTATQGAGRQTGENRSIQLSFENHTVKKLMERIDKILDRYDSCADLGMWNCALYCIGDKVTSEMAASIYRSIIRGKNSALENSSITVWSKEHIPEVMNALRHMEHPRFLFNGLQLTPGTLISSAELAIHAGLPNHSVPGIPVLECAEFGRSVSSYDESVNADGKNYAVNLGSIWHMNQEEELPVLLDANSLASHTFITGSTGVGKSNTVYQVLSECCRLGKRFLVIEPAKGEYKNVFGNQAGVSVYGTNPDLSPLLRINPFSFPHGRENKTQNIHILEHLDRLVEIFNVCWPMYAAMPAVLKEAVEKSYEDCGWNLSESTNAYGTDMYPTFSDVARNIRAIIDSSEYDAENKGAYKGSLLTRLKSLTNGINGQVFTVDEIPSQDLFDKNVIVDLSRVGSAETKSLIMGLLVLKLQEHRMTGTEMNAPLRHVTVLEEAHNLLKRTSMAQEQAGGSLLGKSVEMLANAIAEMRTYGEGFIIADQAPALLDMAVIRNTNTKIIMRLPDKDDRELVGKAANLNDDQITELAKLPRGVAAVYQNEWVEAVLCKVDHYKSAADPYGYTRDQAKETDAHIADRLEIAHLLCTGSSVTGKAELKDLKEKLDKLNLRASAKVLVLRSLQAPLENPRYTKLAPIVSELFPDVRAAFVSSFARTSDTVRWTDDVDAAVRMNVHDGCSEDLLRFIRQCIITDYLHNELGKTDLLERWSQEGGVK